MGRMLTFTNSRDVSLGVKKRTIRRELIIGPTTIKFISLTIFAILAIVYLSFSTADANRSMRIQKNNEDRTEMELRKERLQVERVRLQSLQQIDSGIQKPNLEPISQVQHLDQDKILAKR